VVQFLVGLAALIAAALFLPGMYGAGSTWWLVGALGVAALLGLGTLAAQLWRARIVASGLAILTVLTMYPAISAIAAPRLEQLWVSRHAASLVAKDTRPGDPPVALAGYTEPSLVFYLGSETRLTDGAGAAEVGASQGGLALVEDSERSAFLAHLAELEADAIKLDALSGYNYSRGRKVHITIYRVTATHDITQPPAE